MCGVHIILFLPSLMTLWICRPIFSALLPALFCLRFLNIGFVIDQVHGSEYQCSYLKPDFTGLRSIFQKHGGSGIWNVV